jgi:hypothetical protein
MYCSLLYCKKIKQIDAFSIEAVLSGRAAHMQAQGLALWRHRERALRSLRAANRSTPSNQTTLLAANEAFVERLFDNG